jgi:ribose/xylose/arabinose/galactoside ABC-type transport system permease subunit
MKSNENVRRGAGDLIARYGTLGLMALVCLFLAISVPAFIQPSNLFDVLRQVAVVGIMACGLTYAVAAGGFDLSVGSVAALSTVFVAWLLVRNVPVLAALLVVLAVGAACGWANGLFCARLRIVPWVGTLATMLAVVGPQFMLTGGGSQIPGGLGPKQPLMDFLGKGFLGPVPVAALVMLLVAAVAEIVLSKTALGQHMYAAGGDRVAAETCGIDSRRVLWLAYIFSGVLAAGSGLLMAARMGLGQVRIGEPYLMDAIAAVFLGSTVIKEGRPHILGTIVGAIFMGIMFNGLTLLHTPYWGFYLFRGIMVFAAVALSGFRSR